MRSVLGQRVN